MNKLNTNTYTVVGRIECNSSGQRRGQTWGYIVKGPDGQRKKVAREKFISLAFTNKFYVGEGTNRTKMTFTTPQLLPTTEPDDTTRNNLSSLPTSYIEC